MRAHLSKSNDANLNLMVSVYDVKNVDTSAQVNKFDIRFLLLIQLSINEMLYVALFFMARLMQLMYEHIVNVGVAAH